MFVDSSALVALLLDEPDAPRLAEALGQARQRWTSGLVRLETVMVVSTKLRCPVDVAEAGFDRLLEEARIEVLPITDALARKAVAAFARFGKGRGSKAQLNLADCMSYSVAAERKCPILFVGKDFAQTDLVSALPAK